PALTLRTPPPLHVALPITIHKLSRSLAGQGGNGRHMGERTQLRKGLHGTGPVLDEIHLVDDQGRGRVDGGQFLGDEPVARAHPADRKSTRLNSSHVKISYA